MENRTRRGRYIDISTSPITYSIDNEIFRFSSYKKREIFYRELMNSVKELDKLEGKIFKFTNHNLKDYNICALYKDIAKKVYNNMKHK